MYLHAETIEESWRVFHTIAHHDSYPRVSWLDRAHVHYYDFLSPDASGKRGPGFDLNIPHFEEFHVGLATQHGYYIGLGDYIHPDRKEWYAMNSDIQGPARMSLDVLKSRVTETRKAARQPPFTCIKPEIRN